MPDCNHEWRSLGEDAWCHLCGSISQAGEIVSPLYVSAPPQIQSISAPKPRLLLVGDSPTAPTGFARVTENVLSRLRPEWAVGMIGINATGDPHKLPYPIYPAHLGGDMFGRGRLEDIATGTAPDVVLIVNDPWIVAGFTEVDLHGVPLVAYMPVDAANQPADKVPMLSKLAMAVCYTQYGVDELRLAGYEGPAQVIPHGVDTALYRPIERSEAIRTMGLDEDLPSDVFIVGNVNRNQPRKALDQTLFHFARWVEKYDIPDNVRLLLHCAEDDQGPKPSSVGRWLGINKRLIRSNKEASSMTGVDEAAMPYIYNSFDVQVSTTLGEGWGLTQHEGMACGVPQLVPDWSALGEWPRGAVRYAPISGYRAHDYGLSTIGGVVDGDAFIAELDLLYRDQDLRQEYAALALARATEPRFSWDVIASQFDELLRHVAGVSEPALETANT